MTIREQIIRTTELWTVQYYNELDAGFGYDCGARTIKFGLEPAVAKSIARHITKISPEFIHCWAEEEPKRYW